MPNNDPSQSEGAAWVITARRAGLPGRGLTHGAVKRVAGHTVTFGDISNNPGNTKKASISLKYSPSPSISFPHPTPLHISLVCLREIEAPLQAGAIICSFRARAPEVLHSVRTCNVDSISAAIRRHQLQRTCLFVIPLLLSPSSPPHPHTALTSSVFAIPTLILLLLHPSVLPISILLSPPYSGTHLAFRPNPPVSFPLPLPAVHFTPLHSTSPGPAPRGALQTAYSTVGRHKDM